MAGQGREKGLEKQRNPNWTRGNDLSDRNRILRDGRRRRRIEDDAERQDKKKEIVKN